jgi:PAS domain-containing protein
MVISSVENVSNTESGTRTGLKNFPKFLDALENDSSHILSCFNPSQGVDFISESSQQILGYKCNTGNLHVKPPHKGAIYYRKHINGSVVKFHNTFWSESPSEELFTIDQVLPSIAESFIITMNSRGVVSRCDGMDDFNASLSPHDIIGTTLDSLCTPAHSAAISDAIVAVVAWGRCNYNFYTTLMGNTEVILDFYPCVHDEVVVSITPVRAKIPVPPPPPPDMSTEDSLAVDSAQAIFDTDRRLRELQEEVQYLRNFRDNALLPMYSVNMMGTIVWANDAMVRMMGFEGNKEE